MGSGKTSIGQCLGRRMKHYSFVDIDHAIFKYYGQNFVDLGAFIRKMGWHYFRECELEVLQKMIDSRDNQIVSLGGGSLRKETLPWILGKEKAVMIWPYVEFDLSLKRTKNDKRRPLMDLPFRDLETLYNKRVHYYKKAHIVIKVYESMSINDVTDMVYKRLEEYLKIKL